MTRRSIVTMALLPALMSSSATHATQDTPPEDRILAAGAEMRLPATADALAEMLASIARPSGVPIGFETKLECRIEGKKNQVRSVAARQEKQRDA